MPSKNINLNVPVCVRLKDTRPSPPRSVCVELNGRDLVLLPTHTAVPSGFGEGELLPNS